MPVEPVEVAVIGTGWCGGIERIASGARRSPEGIANVDGPGRLRVRFTVGVRRDTATDTRIGGSPMRRITRRQLVKGAMATTGLALVPDGSRGQAQSGTRLRAFWWGNPDRDKRTKAALSTGSPLLPSPKSIAPLV